MKQDMQQNAAKHCRNLAVFLRRIAECVIEVGREVMGLPVSSKGLAIRFDDSYFVDSESERNRDLREMELGVMTADEFRLKWYGMPLPSAVET